MFPEGQPQVAEETNTQSTQGPDPTSLHLTVKVIPLNCIAHPCCA